MTEQQESDMSKLAWQSQPIDSPTISLAFIHHHAAKLNAQFRREMLMLYGAVVFVIVVGVAVLFTPTVEKTAMTYVGMLGLVLTIAGTIYATLQVRRRSGQVAIRPEESVAASLNAYRAELQRRRNYCLGAWRWSILPLLPSSAVFIGLFWFDPKFRPWLPWLTLFVVVWIPLEVLARRRKAKAFQRELDALDTLERR